MVNVMTDTQVNTSLFDEVLTLREAVAERDATIARLTEALEQVRSVCAGIPEHNNLVAFIDRALATAGAKAGA